MRDYAMLPWGGIMPALCHRFVRGRCVRTYRTYKKPFDRDCYVCCDRRSERYRCFADG